MKRDAIFYQIFKRFPSLFFELIGTDSSQGQNYRFESVEIKEPNFRIDGVFLPPDNAETKTVFFVEVQFQKDQTLYHRFFAELFSYLHRNQDQYDDWHGVLIFPRQSLKPDNDNIHAILLKSSKVQCIYLDTLAQKTQQTIAEQLVALMIASKKTIVEQAKTLISIAKTRRNATLDASDIIDLVATIVVYKFVNLSPIPVNEMDC